MKFFNKKNIAKANQNSTSDTMHNESVIKTTAIKTAGAVALVTAGIQGSEAAIAATAGGAITETLTGHTLATVITTAIGTSALSGPLAPIIIGIVVTATMSATIAGTARFALNSSGQKRLSVAEEAPKKLKEQWMAQTNKRIINEMSKERDKMMMKKLRHDLEADINAEHITTKGMVVEQWQKVVKANKAARVKMFAQDIIDKAPELLLAFR